MSTAQQIAARFGNDNERTTTRNRMGDIETMADACAAGFRDWGNDEQVYKFFDGSAMRVACGRWDIVAGTFVA